MSNMITKGFSWLSVLAAFVAVGMLAYGVSMAQTQQMEPIEAFGMLVRAMPVALGAFALGVVALILNWRTGWPSRGTALTGFGVAALFLGIVAARVAMSWGVPPIHDITTDMADPPQFVEIELPEDRARDAEAQAAWAEAHAEAYSDLRSVVLDRDVAQTIRDAEQLAEEKGWTVRLSDPEQGRLEATATVSGFRFEDEVVIRAQPDGEGRSLVDMRSVSRVGQSDLGVNAERIRDFLEDLSTVR